MPTALPVSGADTHLVELDSFAQAETRGQPLAVARDGSRSFRAFLPSGRHPNHL